MSTNVNPPPGLRIPKQFLEAPDTRSFFEQQREIIFQLWNRTGGSSDSVAATEEGLTSTGSRYLFSKQAETLKDIYQSNCGLDSQADSGPLHE